MRKLSEVYTDEEFPIVVYIPFHESISNEHDVEFFEIESMERDRLFHINLSERMTIHDSCRNQAEDYLNQAKALKDPS